MTRSGVWLVKGNRMEEVTGHVKSGKRGTSESRRQMAEVSDERTIKAGPSAFRE